MSNQNLDGRVALVTGGGGAIGAATALRLARAGALVAVADIRKDTAEEAAHAIAAEGLVAEAFAVDLAREDEIEALAQAVAARLGPIDILHNNAAAGGATHAADKLIADLTADVWDQTFAVNVRAPMLLSRAVVADMVATGRGGAIVNTSSGASEVAFSDARAAYGASKAALQTLTRYIAAQYGPQGVRCNAILPGVVITARMRESYGEDAIAAMTRRTLLHRGNAPEDIAAVVHFLVSDDARQITGELIRISGGHAR